jgi:hypothetical protein
MSTELTQALVLQEGMSDAEYNQIMGIAPSNGPSVPRLTINRDPGEDIDNPIPLGYMRLSMGKDKPTYYAKEFTIRVIVTGYQYKRWDNDKKAYTDESIIGLNPRDIDSFISKSGKLRCGKLSAAQKKKIGVLSPEDEADQKCIKYRVHFFVLVSGTGKDYVTGETETFENQPALMQFSFSGAKPLMDLVEGIVAQPTNNMTLRYNIKLKAKKETSGGTIFYVITPEVDMKNLVNPTAEDFNNAQSAIKYIKRYNNRVMEATPLSSDDEDVEVDDQPEVVTIDLNDANELADAVKAQDLP